MKIDLNHIQSLREQGIVSSQSHPDLPLLIHNYTPRCQLERLWSETALMCRGLITDLEGNIISRPFPKFFNLEEHTDQTTGLTPINWRQDFYVSEKVDGSLGILYPTPTGYRIATRGSFVSDQARRGTLLLSRLRAQDFRDGWTHVFEIIYPENRIVLNYGGKESLVLLDVIHNETGFGLCRTELEAEAERLGCEIVQNHVLTSTDLLNYASDIQNREGVVVRFEDGSRIKIKLAEYCRLHKLITGVNSRTIWELLRSQGSLEAFLDQVPDEFFSWVKATAARFHADYAEIERDVRRCLAQIQSELGENSRKQYAERFKAHDKFMSILFLMLDQRDYSQVIWKMLRPEIAVAFSKSDETSS